VLGDKDFSRLHRAYIGCKQRLALLIETGAWERCKSKPKVLANAINPFRFCGNSLSQCAASEPGNCLNNYHETFTFLMICTDRRHKE
jgi:hypothetical protein